MTGDPDDRLLTTDEVAAFLDVAPATVKDWRARRLPGPRFVKVGNAVRYRPSDVAAWVESNVQESAPPRLAPLPRRGRRRAS